MGENTVLQRWLGIFQMKSGCLPYDSQRIQEENLKKDLQEIYLLAEPFAGYRLE